MWVLSFPINFISFHLNEIYSLLFKWWWCSCCKEKDYFSFFSNDGDDYLQFTAWSHSYYHLSTTKTFTCCCCWCYWCMFQANEKERNIQFSFFCGFWDISLHVGYRTKQTWNENWKKFTFLKIVFVLSNVHSSCLCLCVNILCLIFRLFAKRFCPVAMFG